MLGLCKKCKIEKEIHCKALCKACYMKQLRSNPINNERKKRRDKIINLRCDGLSFAEIGNIMGCTKQNAQQLFNKQLKKMMASKKPSNQWFELYDTSNNKKVFIGVATNNYDLRKSLRSNEDIIGVGIIDKKVYKLELE